MYDILKSRMLMKKWVNGLWLAALVICGATLMTACSDSDNNSKKSDSNDDSITYRRSLIVYMAAQNSLGDAGAARLDSAEIVAGVARTTSTRDNVFLFIDDGKKPRLYRYYRNGNAGNLRTYEQKVLTWPNDANSADPATLRDVLRYVSIHYPSSSYGMVMWSHGNGWIPSTNIHNTLFKSTAFSRENTVFSRENTVFSRNDATSLGDNTDISRTDATSSHNNTGRSHNNTGFSHNNTDLSHNNSNFSHTNAASSRTYSEVYPSAFGVDVGEGGDMENDTDTLGRMGTQMDISDMAEAILQSGIHLDYILFDACLMQCVEVAYALRDVTDYVVGNASSTSAYGGYYANLLPQALMVYPANDYNISLIASQYYYDAVSNASLSQYYERCGAAISVIKTSELDNLASITGTFLSRYITNRNEPDMQDAQAYSDTDFFNTPNFYDMGSAMYLILSQDDYQSWLRQAEKCIIYHHVSDTYVLGTYYGQQLYDHLTDPDHVLGVSMFVPRRIFDRRPYSPYNTYFQQTEWYSAASWNLTGW